MQSTTMAASSSCTALAWSIHPLPTPLKAAWPMHTLTPNPHKAAPPRAPTPQSVAATASVKVLQAPPRMRSCRCLLKAQEVRMGVYKWV
jgi:hypothetical protein